MARTFYSIRTGKNRNAEGFPLEQILQLFSRLYGELRADGYFDEYLGWCCVDMGEVEGLIKSPDVDVLVKLRKSGLWPIEQMYTGYGEDDLLDIIEYLFSVVSKPIDGTMHSYADCGMHWETFNKKSGEAIFRERINEILAMYERGFELSRDGEILQKADEGFERMFEADIPTSDQKVRTRVESAMNLFRRHGSTIDDRRHAVRDLADVLELLRPHMKDVIDNKDESDLFNIANNFAIRHHNSRQKGGYDAALWLSWMFYFYLATIHVVLRKIGDKRPDLVVKGPHDDRSNRTK